MKLQVTKGTTAKLLTVFIQDSSSTTGAGLTGLVFNSASLTGYYYREGAATAVAITLATMTVGTWASGGFKEVDATNMPGVYQVGIPDAALVTGANSVIVMLKGAANMAPSLLEVQLQNLDSYDGVRGGLTALPNVASGSAGAIPTTGTGANQLSVASGLVTLAGVTHTGAVIPTVTTTTNLTTNNDKAGYGLAANAVDASQFTQAAADKIWTSASRTLSAFAQGFSDQVWTTAARTLTAFGFSVTVGTNNDKTGYGLSAAAVQAIWDALTSALTTVGSIGKLLVTNIDAAISSRLAPTVGGRTLDVAATGEAGLDFDNIHDATGAHTLTNITVPVVTTVTNPQGDTSGTTTLLARLTAGRATNLDNLDAAVSTRLATSGYTAPLDAATTKAQVVTALTTDTYAEPSAVPAATASLKDKIGWLAVLARNRVTQTSTTQTVRNSADSGTVATAAVSDDGTIFTRGGYS